MNTRESLITLSIREAQAPPRAFLYHLRVDAEVVAANQQLSPEDSQAVRDFSRQFSALFEQRFTPQIAADNLKALGSQLFNLWLAPTWEKLTAKVPVGAPGAGGAETTSPAGRWPGCWKRNASFAE